MASIGNYFRRGTRLSAGFSPDSLIIDQKMIQISYLLFRHRLGLEQELQSVELVVEPFRSPGWIHVEELEEELLLDSWKERQSLLELWLYPSRIQPCFVAWHRNQAASLGQGMEGRRSNRVVSGLD